MFEPNYSFGYWGKQMSRTAALSFLAIASFTLAGADYYVQAKAAKQSFKTYGLSNYKENVTERVSALREPQTGDVYASNTQKPSSEIGRIKTQAQVEAERKRELDEVIPEVWEHLSSADKDGFKLPQTGHMRKSKGISFKRVQVKKNNP